MGRLTFRPPGCFSVGHLSPGSRADHASIRRLVRSALRNPRHAFYAACEKNNKDAALAPGRDLAGPGDTVAVVYAGDRAASDRRLDHRILERPFEAAGIDQAGIRAVWLRHPFYGTL